MSREKESDKLSQLEQQAFDAKSTVARTSKRNQWLKLLCYILLAELLIQPLFYTFIGRRWGKHRTLSLAETAAQVWSYSAFAREPVQNGGFSAQGMEKLYLSVPNEKSALEASRVYASRPHRAGSEEDYELALTILKLFQEQWNIRKDHELPVFPAGSCQSRQAIENLSRMSLKPSAWVHVYYPVMNTPLERSLQILDEDGDVVWDADLVEDGNSADPEAAKYRDSVPAWHGLSADGDVQGQLIYANYGRQEDYQELLSRGVDFTGKIVLTRSGHIWRGLKVKGAQELGAAGVLTYTDPRDDGVVTVENGYTPYPHGPARNPTSVERGSVQFISLYPGDPTTPGYPAYENSNRTEAKNIPKIPSLPISWENAQQLLAEIASGEARRLTGQVSQSTIRLENHVNTRVMPIWNTVGVIPGHIKNETIIIGGHRDAWVMGAADPVSGHSSLHEVIRGFGTLMHNGWKPLRTILMISWDAEEYGTIGSTEWVEDFADWIDGNVVAYINLDGSAAGAQWHASSSPSLAHLISTSAQDIPHPTEPGKTLWDARNDIGPYVNGEADSEFMALYQSTRSKSSDTEINLLGSGSDFAPFLQRLGIPSMDEAFDVSPHDAAYHYHSVYDTQRWMEIYGDPGFHRHVTVAKHVGLVALRLADSLILPLNTTQYALELDDYLDQIETLTPFLSYSIDFSPLRKAIARVQRASCKLDIEKRRAEEEFNWLRAKLPTPCGGDHTDVWCKIREILTLALHPLDHFYTAAARAQRVNAKLVAFEKGFISEDGIDGREWYRHLGVAPGKWLGYGATTFPSIYDALVWGENMTAASLEVERVSQMLNKLAVALTP